MITDFQILKALQKELIEKLPEHFLEETDVLYPLTEKQIVIDNYDIDNLPAKVSIFINPGYEDNEIETMSSAASVFTCELFCICKGMQKTELVRQAQAYKSAIEHLIGTDNTLSDTVDFVEVTSSKWFGGVETVGIARAFMLEIQFRYAKNYS